jgi:hypothetical protein
LAGKPVGNTMLRRPRQRQNDTITRPTHLRDEGAKFIEMAESMVGLCERDDVISDFIRIVNILTT